MNSQENIHKTNCKTRNKNLNSFSSEKIPIHEINFNKKKRLSENWFPSKRERDWVFICVLACLQVLVFSYHKPILLHLLQPTTMTICRSDSFKLKKEKSITLQNNNASHFSIKCSKIKFDNLAVTQIVISSKGLNREQQRRRQQGENNDAVKTTRRKTQPASAKGVSTSVVEVRFTAEKEKKKDATRKTREEEEEIKWLKKIKKKKEKW
jgi:hypothetical protein